MKKFLIFSIVLCASCSIIFKDIPIISQENSSVQTKVSPIKVTLTPTLLESPILLETQITTKIIEESSTPIKEPTYPENPTYEYESLKRERFDYFWSNCPGYTILDYLSPDLNWILCVTEDSIFINNIDGNQWEIPVYETYKNNIEVQNIKAFHWSNDGAFVYISYEETIALWRVSLDNGSIKEILISNRIKDRGEDAVYIISLSPTGEYLIYFNYLERIKYLYIIDLLSDSKSKIYIGFGETGDSYNWSPDGNKIIFNYYMFTDSDGIDAHYDNIIYYLEFPIIRITRVFSISHFEYLEIIDINNDYIIYKTAEGQWKYEYITHSTTKL